ncbi:hypothetical protein ACFUIV_21210 [Streptomyces anulatus]|uniref:hypothetical protein n=1 Tax=Streptomyces anulatus TaxID=1892 RepID=UPI003636F88E
MSTPVDYDPEDVQFSARTDDGDVVMYLPEITYLDTQPWSVEIGLTPGRLVQLRDALDNHLRGAGGTANRGDTPTVAAPGGGVANASRVDIDTTGPDGGAACPPVMGERPTTVVQQTTVATSSEGAANDRGSSGTSVATQTEATVTETVTVPLRERLRGALRHHIDPDDDTMPALCRDGFLWVPADDVLDDLVKALSSPDPIEVLARVAVAVDTPSGPPEEPSSEYGIGWDTAMDLVRAAIEEQP